MSRAIDDPSLWALAFSDSGDSVLRHAIKRAAKRTFRNLGVLRVDDDEAFGAATIRLIRIPAGRAELKSHHLDRNLLSSSLLDAICGRHTEVLPELDEVAPTDDEGWRRLGAESMREWLAKNPLNDESRLAVSAFLCAFAMRDQTDARTLAIELLESDPKFAPLLALKDTATETDDGLEDFEQEQEEIVAHEALSNAPSTQTGSHEPASAASTTGSEKLSLAEWRREIVRLRHRVAVEEQRLGELDQMALAVAAEAEVVATLPWSREPLELGEIARLREDATAATEQVRLQDLQSRVARVLRAHSQAEALTQRLGRQPVRSLPGGKVALDDLAALLEGMAGELASEAEAIAQIIESGRGFLDRLAAGDAATAVEMSENAPPTLWSQLARTIFDPSLNSAEMHELRAALATESIAGLLLAKLARTDRRSACDLLRWLSPAVGGDPQVTRAEAVFGFLSFVELREIAPTVPSAAEAAALLIFSAALRRNRADLLEHLAPFFEPGVLDGISREFYRTLLDIRHRGGLEEPAAELRQANAAKDEAQAHRAELEAERQRLLVWLNSPPGMKRNFHRLRVYAQVQFLHPLRAAIEQGDATGAWRQWQAFGSLDTMVNACISHLKSTDRPEARHYEQTQAYIEDFGVDLERWMRIRSTHSVTASAALLRALDTLRAEAPRNAAAAALLHVAEAAGGSPNPAFDFGDRIEADERIRIPREEAAPWLVPTMLATWPRAMEGEATLTHLLADTLRMSLAPLEITLAQAVETYLASDQLEAARRAAASDPELQAKVTETFNERRQALFDTHADLLAEAERAAEVDVLAAEYVGAARAALSEYDFADAEAAFELLSEAIADFRRRSDPMREALTAWIREADVSVALEVTTAELERQVAQLRAQAVGRRAHIQALNTAANHARAAEPVKTLWIEAARQLDRPGAWTEPNDSALLAEDIAIIGRNLRGKWQSRLSDSDPSATVVRRIAEWVPERLHAGLLAREPSALDPLHHLSEMLDEGCGDAALLRFLGAAPESAPVGVPRQAIVPPPVVQRTAAPPTEPAISVSSATRPDLLPKMLSAESPAASADFPKLRLAARAERWAEVRRIASALAQATPAPNDDVRNDLIAVFGAAQLAETAGAPDWLAEATAALLTARRADYYLGETFVKEFGPRAVLRILPSEEESVAEQLGDSLLRGADLVPSDPAFLQLGEFFRAVDAAAPRLVELLWENFTGLPRVEQPRSALLRLLYRLREVTALKYLVEKTKEDKVRPIIKACLDAFVTAETQPEARPAALQLSAVLREQAVGVANTLPWIMLFHTIQGARGEAETISVQADLDSEFPSEDGGGALSLELRIQPSLFDPPARLTVRLGNAAPFPLCEEPVFTKRVVRVPLPPQLEFASDGECLLSYTIEGLTVSGVSISQAGVWTVIRAERLPPIESWRLETLWPGAKRDPVLRDHGFFGRDRETREIESRLMATPRARSIMLFGERRIGKTSLIRNLIASTPPARGHICGVFSDVSGLQAAPGELAVKFFDRIVTFLDNESDNGPIVEALQRAQKRIVPARELSRGLKPGASLYAALEGLARRLEELSGGEIGRIALFVDEFDRFVVPMIGDRREEVNQLMWELRQVIQRSNRVALVLAGSGLQRLYKENYQDALFGSIDEVSLFRFDWERDRVAIRDTFLPESVRLQLCRPSDVERVTHRAAEICDGHPMFLALLGSAAAKLAEGRPLTPGFFDRVVSAMMRERGILGGETLERQVFYGFIFDQLDVVAPRLAALAKGLFSALAENTLPDAHFSSLRITRLFEIAALPGARTGELLEALDRLVKIDAVHNDKASGRVRISVPLTAAAAREDAPRLREEARERLRNLEVQK